MPDSPSPQPMSRGLLCPYCGAVSPNAKSCGACGGLFEPLSRQATQNSMGPWFLRDESRPFMPGCSYEVILVMVRKGKIGVDTIMRGPTTNQFWAFARRVPGVANFLGLCHACAARVPTDASRCPSCQVSFEHRPDRQSLGLGPVRAVPARPATAKTQPEAAPNGSRGGGMSPGAAGMIILLVLACAGLAWGGYTVLQWSESSARTGDGEMAPGNTEPPIVAGELALDGAGSPVPDEPTAGLLAAPETAPEMAAETTASWAESGDAVAQIDSEVVASASPDGDPDAGPDANREAAPTSVNEPVPVAGAGDESAPSAQAAVALAADWAGGLGASGDSLEVVMPGGGSVTVTRDEILALTAAPTAYLRVFAAR